MPSAVLDHQTRSGSGITKFTNCALIKGNDLVEEDLWVSSITGKIIHSQEVFYEQRMIPDRIIDLGGRIVSPGFIDVQFNGAYGFDFSVLPENGISAYGKGVLRVNKSLIKTGVTSYLPTITSQRPEVYHKVCQVPTLTTLASTQTHTHRPDPNQRASGPLLPRALGCATRPIRGLRITRRALRRPVHQPDQKRHPQHLRPTHRPRWPRRPRGLLRRAQPHVALAHQAANPRARAARRAILHPRADIAGHHSRNRALGSNVQRSARGHRRRRDHDHAPIQRNAPAAPPQPGHLRAARHALALALQHADGRPRRAEAVLRPHRRRHPPAPDVRQDRVERAPGRLRPGH